MRPRPVTVIPVRYGPGMPHPDQVHLDARGFDISDLATRCAPDPDARPMMTAVNADRFAPYDDRLVAVADKPTDRYGELWLPEKRNSHVWTVYGRVVAVGSGRRLSDGTRAPMAVRVGDRIVWSYRPSREEQTMREMFGDRAILLREAEVLGVVEDDGDDWKPTCGHDPIDPKCPECCPF